MSEILIAGPGLQITFAHENNRLALRQICRSGDEPLLPGGPACPSAGKGPLGNPLTIVILKGDHAGIYPMDSFSVTQCTHDARMLHANLRHDTLPLTAIIEVEVEGNVATWRGQVCWWGPVSVDMDIYYPVLSGIKLNHRGADRALVALVSGSVIPDLTKAHFRSSHIGSLSSPVFIIDGGDRGLALVDDNRADYAADPGACAQRSLIISNQIPLDREPHAPNASAVTEPAGPFAGTCYRRSFAPPDPAIFRVEAERSLVRHDGDSVDIGPVRMYLYEGPWKQGALWLRTMRRHLKFRTSPAQWYQRTTFIGEDMGDDLVKRGQTFYDYPEILKHKQAGGADLFHLPGFHDPEVLGSNQNWLNRGDYTLAAQNLGGFEAVARGVEAVHRRGGRILYYVEALIIWKRSRIGRSQAKQWALMDENGNHDLVYKGFWHMCPACSDWCQWLARTCAEIVRTTGVDGFFFDSACATHNHRCFNPAHHHPHPDVWTWGMRQLLRTVREELDKVNPETVLFVEGAGDMAREYADGFVSHTHEWTRMTFNEPLVRFLHPQMRTFESWSNQHATAKFNSTPQFLHLWNAVTGHRIYSHAPDAELMAGLATKTRQYYDLFPEVCDNAMSALDIKTANCFAQLFEGDVRVLTVGNLSGAPAAATLTLPVPCGILFDRVDGSRIVVEAGHASLKLAPWEFRAFELRM